MSADDSGATAGAGTANGAGGIADGGGFDAARLGRTLALIAVVTAVFLLTGANLLTGTLFSVAVVAIGAIALVTAITGALIALASATE